MNRILQNGLAAAAAVFAAQATADVTFYEHGNFQGRSFTTGQQITNLERSGFNNRASSVEVRGEPWQVCDGAGFSGSCVVLREGRYASLGDMGLNDSVSSVRIAGRDSRVDDRRYSPPPPPVAAQPGPGQITFYEGERFAGRSFTTERQVRDFERFGFNDRASSVIVDGERWEVCDGPRFTGRCRVLRPGQYASLSAMGLNDRVSSVRIVRRDVRVDENRYAPSASARHDYRRRDNERLYEANVTSVRAVLGTPERRCWVEQEQIPQDRRAANVPGAIAGAVIGGILGHQIGSGSGQDIATVGGAVAGGALGSQVGRSGAQPARTQDVQRCENVPSAARPDYWDVTYMFRGQEYRMQMTTPPGSTVTVNDRGEPRA
ncbi:MAG TPA: beta/gamma crystallin-related protein [Burkholderiales bacterium]|nr:beta/gamma crystallin-related protein [Burkholderiales bacterium]